MVIVPSGNIHVTVVGKDVFVDILKVDGSLKAYLCEHDHWFVIGAGAKVPVSTEAAMFLTLVVRYAIEGGLS